jgi:hypothetical protein
MPPGPAASRRDRSRLYAALCVARPKIAARLSYAPASSRHVRPSPRFTIPETAAWPRHRQYGPSRAGQCLVPTGQQHHLSGTRQTQCPMGTERRACRFRPGEMSTLRDDRCPGLIAVTGQIPETTMFTMLSPPSRRFRSRSCSRQVTLHVHKGRRATSSQTHDRQAAAPCRTGTLPLRRTSRPEWRLPY